MEIRGSNPLGGTTPAPPPRAAAPLLPSGAMEIMGVQIRTIIKDNVAIRCDGCLEVIDGTPWRVNLLDIVAAESPVAWTERPTINPGPFQFHGDPACVRRWMADKGYLFCRRGEVREIMRPVAIPGAIRRGGACATASIATITSSSRPDAAPARRRARRPFDRASRRAYPPPPGRISDTQIYPDSRRAYHAMSTGRPERIPPRSPDPSAPLSRPRVSDTAAARSPLVVARTGEPAGRRRSRTPFGAGPTRAGSRRT